MENRIQPIKITEQLIAEVDKRVVSPDERANYIWQLLKKEHPDLTDWDVLCFAIEYIGMMHTVHSWLEFPAKHLTSLLYNAHYLNSEAIDAGSIIKREPVSEQKESQHRTESESDSIRIVKTGEYDGGGG